MRLWSIHPKYLDAKGLVALWREGLLAYAVLKGKTRGYRHHPQLARFRKASNPVSAIRAYLHVVCDEAEVRGYHFDRSKLGRKSRVDRLPVKTGQLVFELRHLKKKLRKRDPAGLRKVRSVKMPEQHPAFRVTRGGIEEWEKGNSVTSRK